MEKGKVRGWPILLSLFALIWAFFTSTVPLTSRAATANKVPTANPIIQRGILSSGSYVDVQASDNTRMRIRESLSGGIRYIDMLWQSWQAFAEASRDKLLSIRVVLEGYQNNAGDSWYVQFYDFDAGSWDSAWYLLGSLPTTPEGTLQLTMGDPTLARRFVGTGGAFRLRLADNNTAQGGGDGRRTDLFIDLLQAQFVFDILPPASVVVSPVDMEYTNASTYLIRGTSSDTAPDPSGVQRVDVSTDGGMNWYETTPSVPGDWSSWSYQWQIPGEGTYLIRSQAIDHVNNQENPEAGVRLVVDWTPPQVASVTPAPGASNVPVEAVIRATFSDAHGIRLSSVNDSTFTLTDEEGRPVPGSVTYDPASMTATFDPDGELLYGCTYTATISTGVTDMAGNPLTSQFTWSFRTADILSLSLVGTYNRDGSTGSGGVGFGTVSPEGSPYVIGGGTPPYAARFKVLSTTRWNLYLQAQSDLADGSQSPPVTIPVHRLHWRVSGSQDWTPFSIGQVTVFNPPPGRTPQPGGRNVDFELMLRLEWEDPPGNYSTTVLCVLMVQP